MKILARRIAATVAVVATAAAGLAGCSSPGGTSAGGATEITYWLWQDNATDTTWQSLADKFNSSQSEVKVTLESIPLDQYQNQLVTAILNNTAPDAARSKDWWLGQFAPNGALADLASSVNGWSGKSDVVEQLWNTGKLPGKSEIYMLPHQYTTLYLYYRKDLFASAGLSAPTTQAELLDAAAKLTTGGNYGIDVRGGGGGQDQWLAWIYAGGADVVDASGAVVLDNAKAVEVNQRYLDIVTKLKAAPPGSITAAFADVKTNFASGKTAMMIHHPGSLAEMEKTFGDKLGVVPIPTSDGSQGATLGSMSGNVVLAGSQKKDAAWKWISWLSEKAQMEIISDSAQGQLPVLTSVLDRDKYRTAEGLKVATAAIPTAKTWPALKGVANLTGKEWSPTIQSAFQGQLSSQDALTKMAEILRSGS